MISDVLPNILSDNLSFLFSSPKNIITLFNHSTLDKTLKYLVFTNHNSKATFICNKTFCWSENGEKYVFLLSAFEPPKMSQISQMIYCFLCGISWCNWTPAEKLSHSVYVFLGIWEGKGVHGLFIA